jgi:hypothetical protein
MLRRRDKIRARRVKVSPEGQISKNATKGEKTVPTLFNNPILR